MRMGHDRLGVCHGTLVESVTGVRWSAHLQICRHVEHGLNGPCTFLITRVRQRPAASYLTARPRSNCGRGTCSNLTTERARIVLLSVVTWVKFVTFEGDIVSCYVEAAGVGMMTMQLLNSLETVARCEVVRRCVLRQWGRVRSGAVESGLLLVCDAQARSGIPPKNLLVSGEGADDTLNAERVSAPRPAYDVFIDILPAIGKPSVKDL